MTDHREDALDRFFESLWSGKPDPADFALDAGMLADAVELHTLSQTPIPGSARERARQRVFDSMASSQENDMTRSPCRHRCRRPTGIRPDCVLPGPVRPSLPDLTAAFLVFIGRGACLGVCRSEWLVCVRPFRRECFHSGDDSRGARRNPHTWRIRLAAIPRRSGPNRLFQRSRPRWQSRSELDLYRGRSAEQPRERRHIGVCLRSQGRSLCARSGHRGTALGRRSFAKRVFR